MSPEGARTAGRQSDPELEALLDYLKEGRGFDFTGYKRSSLTRRMAKRMHEVGCTSFAEYQDFLEVHPGEFQALFDTIWINVTGFFRDPEAWDALAAEVLPRLLAQMGDDEPIRVWSAGCASGEEPYTIAILLAEALGVDAFRARVKIYATDVDDDALNQARSGVYSPAAVEGVPTGLLERYFEPQGSQMAFSAELRRNLIFGRNDLSKDAPISRVDLLACRNTLMYFTAEAQTRILGHFHFALRDRGVLFLGKSELLITRGELFAPVSHRARAFRAFRKVSRRSMRERLIFAAQDAEEDGDAGGADGDAAALFALRERAFDTAPVAQIVVDRGGHLVLANAEARRTFSLAPPDLGRALSELDVSYRPADLRPALESVFERERPVSLGTVLLSGRDRPDRHVDIAVAPLAGADGEMLGATATFTDVSAALRLHDDLDRSRRELELAYEELQSTVEELETTNEELQSTNEELETTNEELQSTNEELETMNEELRAANEQLEATNDQLRARSEDLDEVNGLLETVLTGLRVGAAVLGTDQRVRVWNDRAEEMWGLRADEAFGEHLVSLDIGLPVEELVRPVREAMAGAARHELLLAAHDRRGRDMRCKITVVAVAGDSEDAPRGAIVLMEDLGAEEPA